MHDIMEITVPTILITFESCLLSIKMEFEMNECAQIERALHLRLGKWRINVMAIE